MTAYDRVQIEKNSEISLTNQTYFYIVEEGEIELSEFLDNQKCIIDVLGKNEVFGATILQENDDGVLYVKALSCAYLLRIPQSDLTKWSKMQSSFTNALSKILFFNIQKLRNKIKNNSLIFQKTTKREGETLNE